MDTSDDDDLLALNVSAPKKAVQKVLPPSKDPKFLQFLAQAEKLKKDKEDKKELDEANQRRAKERAEEAALQEETKQKAKELQQEAGDRLMDEDVEVQQTAQRFFTGPKAAAVCCFADDAALQSAPSFGSSSLSSPASMLLVADVRADVSAAMKHALVKIGDELDSGDPTARQKLADDDRKDLFAMIYGLSEADDSFADEAFRLLEAAISEQRPSGSTLGGHDLFRYAALADLFPSTAELPSSLLPAALLHDDVIAAPPQQSASAKRSLGWSPSACDFLCALKCMGAQLSADSAGSMDVDEGKATTNAVKSEGEVALSSLRRLGDLLGVCLNLRSAADHFPLQGRLELLGAMLRCYLDPSVADVLPSIESAVAALLASFENDSARDTTVLTSLVELLCHKVSQRTSSRVRLLSMLPDVRPFIVRVRCVASFALLSELISTATPSAAASPRAELSVEQPKLAAVCKLITECARLKKQHKNAADYEWCYQVYRLADLCVGSREDAAREHDAMQKLTAAFHEASNLAPGTQGMKLQELLTMLALEHSIVHPRDMFQSSIFSV